LREIKCQLDLLNARIQSYEGKIAHCTSECAIVADGLRLSQEVEILRRENLALTAENESLKRDLARLLSTVAAG
jgi:hypothetical protein